MKATLGVEPSQDAERERGRGRVKDSPTPGLHFDPFLPGEVELFAPQPRVDWNERRLTDLLRQRELSQHHDEGTVERVGEKSFCGGVSEF